MAKRGAGLREQVRGSAARAEKKDTAAAALREEREASSSMTSAVVVVACLFSPSSASSPLISCDLVHPIAHPFGGLLYVHFASARI
jgi:hypothetical protein